MIKRCEAGVIWAVWAGALMFSGGGAAAAPVMFAFAIDPAASTTAATIDVSAKTSGTLIGNWDAVENPGGTRTKPGILGAFGDMENVAAPVTIDPVVAGPIDSSAAGVFELVVDPEAGTVGLSALSADLLSLGPVALPVEAAIGLSSFRTRNPASTYLSANVNLPLGDATVSALRAVQTAGVAAGTLSATGVAGEYAFEVVAMVALEAEVEFEGNVITAPADAIALPLSGTIRINGDVAMLTASGELALDQTDAPQTELPAFDFAMPTVLPPGETANVILDLMLNETTTVVSGTSTIRASGTVVPEPGVIGLLAGLAPLCGRGQRRRGAAVSKAR